MSVEKAIKARQPMTLHSKTVINIMYTSRLVEEAAWAILKPFDLTIPQYNVLRILRGQKGKPASLGTIQERMIDKSSNTSRLVDKLLAKGLVERRRCAQNRRKVEIAINAAGMDILKRLDAITEANNRKILEDFQPEQLEKLNELLDILHKQ